VKSFSDRGFLSKSECKSKDHTGIKGIDCDFRCDECVKDGPGSCTSCKSGYYLSLNDSTKSYGSCVQMEASNASLFTIFVTPTLTDAYDASTIN
jgi:hypothetical protein